MQVQLLQEKKIAMEQRAYTEKYLNIVILPYDKVVIMRKRISLSLQPKEELLLRRLAKKEKITVSKLVRNFIFYKNSVRKLTLKK